MSDEGVVKHDNQIVPSYGEINIVFHDLLQVLERTPGGPRIRADTAVIVRELRFVFGDTAV